MNLFLVKERVDPELLYIFLTRLMHSANSFFFLIFLKVEILKEYHLNYSYQYPVVA